MRRTIVALAAVLAAVPLVAQPLQGGAQSPQSGRRVAITIDDGPVVNEMSDLGNFQRITNGLIGSFQVEKVPVTIFVNEAQLNVPGQRDARAAVLDQWLDAGFELGNHAYSHRSANRVPFDQFADDVVKGEVIMRPLVERRGQTLMWFRFPYLHSGTTADAHQAIVTFLESRNYRVAPVTVDYADYTFAGAYTRALRSGKIDVAEHIKSAYIEQVDVGFDHAEKASTEVYGREIAQILLIHCNELNAVAVSSTLARMRQRGYTFISLAEAMQDEAYARADTFAGSGGSWLSRSATAMGKKIESTTPPRVPAWITETR